MDTNQHKYQRHSEKQHEFILNTAEQLFIEKGIGNVSLTDIAKACGIMRQTFYRYFNDKEDIIWEMVYRNTALVAQKTRERLRETTGTTYERFQVYIDILYDNFLTNPGQVRFVDSVLDDYMFLSDGMLHPNYQRYFNEGMLPSSETIKLLSENFHDGTVRPDLEPHATTISVVYSAWAIISSMSRQLKSLPAKHAISAEEIARAGLDHLLKSISA